MRLLWLDINASYSHSSLALPALHAQLTETQLRGVDWHVISSTVNSDPATCFIDIALFKPDIILSTVWLYNHTYILNLLSKYKRIYPLTSIVLGGPEFLGDNSDYLFNNKFVNAVFRGEGEDIFPHLFHSLVNNLKWDDIPGMCWLDTKDAYIDNGEGIVNDIDKLVPPEESKFFNWEKPFVQIETSRGCFNNCSFCISGGCRSVHNISLSKIKERLENIRSRGVKEVRVLDRTFNSNSKRAVELLDVFRIFNGDITFHLEIHPALLSDELKQKISILPAGLLHLEAGLQSLDNNVLTACKRLGTSEKSIDGIKYIVSLDKFELHVDLIVGLPFYTFQRVLEDIKLLIPLGIDEIQLELLKLLPGTELREKSNTFNIIFSSFPPYEVLCTNSISPLEIYKLIILSKVLDIWHNNPIWRYAFRKISSVNDSFIEMFLDYILKNKLPINNISLESKGIILAEFCEKHQKDAVSDVASAWIEAGLSLKKGPGKLARQWIRGLSAENNPIFDERNQLFNYYFIIESKREFWYAFNRADKKGKPAKFHINY